MPFTLNGPDRLYWREDGAADRPAILLLGALGQDLGLWDRALPHMVDHFRVVRMDLRGSGASDAPEGPYSLQALAADARAVLDAAGLPAAFVCGVGLGAAVALALALEAPGRVRGVIAASVPAEADRGFWQAARDAALGQGMAALADPVVAETLSAAFRRSHPEVAATVRSGLMSAPPQGFAGCCAALRDMDLLPALPSIAAPVLVIGGKRDAATPFEAHGRRVAEAIPGARSVHLDTGHLAPLEAPQAFAGAVAAFAADVLDGGHRRQVRRDLYDIGMTTRRRVLGDAWVDRSLAGRTDFNADYQDMVTRYAWDEIWARPGLDHRTRRLLVLAITASLGRWEEFRLHMRIGLEQAGFTAEDVKEVLLQAGVYAGLPVAHTGFVEAAAILREHEAKADEDGGA